MATVYGVTPTGFVRKPLLQIVADLSAAQKATIAATLDVSTDSVLGQINGIFANELGIVWEQLEICYHANDPDATEDLLLTMLCKLTGTLRRAATPSAVVLQCALVAGTTLLAGTHFASIVGRPDLRWTPAADFTAGSSATLNVEFVSEDLGPIDGFATTITVIATPVIGWTSVNNALDADLGNVIDSDSTLQLRREQELAAVGSTTVRAIKAKVLEAFTTTATGIVQNVNIYENDKDYVDGTTGNPPHSLEVLIFDGISPSVANDAIAQLIWDNKAGGIQTVGNASGTAFIDQAQTIPVTVYFSRVAVVPIYLVYVITTGAGYTGDTPLKGLIADNANAVFGPSQNVTAEIVKAMILPPNVGVAGVTDITSFTIGTAPSPVGTTNVAIGLRQIANFQTTQISITS